MLRPALARRSVAADVIGVGAGIDDEADGLIGELFDRGHHAVGCGEGSGVDDDCAIGAGLHRDIAAGAGDHVEIRADAQDVEFVVILLGARG